MEEIVRVHFSKKDGKRSTISLDKKLSEVILDLGYNNLVEWVQRTYERMAEELEKGLRSPLDKSLSREIQSEAISEIRRSLQRQRDRVNQKEEELQAKEISDPFAKYIIFAFEGIARKGLLADQNISVKLDYLRKEFKTAAEHYKSHGWSIDDKKLLLRLSQAVNEICRQGTERHPHVTPEVRRCEAETTQKKQCKGNAIQYIIKDEREYLACKKHATHLFLPFLGIEGRPKGER